MALPPLLHLPDEAAYRQHFVGTYCRGGIETHDGIRVFFQQNKFDHAFYESTNRDGVKDVFSWVRAERMNWIGATLADPAAVRYQGWVPRTRSYDPARRVDLLYEDFVVVLGLGLNRAGALRANFITCFQADNSVAKIRTPSGPGRTASMRCAEKIWALIRHAGSAPEASIGSKPIGSELVHENASLAAKCQEILDGSVARPLRTSRELTRANPHQPIDIKTDFKGNPLKWAKMGRLEACP